MNRMLGIEIILRSFLIKENRVLKISVKAQNKNQAVFILLVNY